MIAKLRDRYDVWRYRRAWKKAYNYLWDLSLQEHEWQNDRGQIDYAEAIALIHQTRRDFEADVEKWGL